MIKIHHCRSCGQGFCDECSSKKKPVPERGWGAEPVRVCDNCFLKDSKGQVFFHICFAIVCSSFVTVS